MSFPSLLADSLEAIGANEGEAPFGPMVPRPGSEGAYPSPLSPPSAWAYVDGWPLHLGLPQQTLNGEAYVPVEFVRALIEAPGGTFRPAGLATRVEATVMIGRLLDWLAGHGEG